MSVVLIAAAVVVGIVLRAWALGDQLVAGDEIHGLRAAVLESPTYLLTHNTVPGYEESDYSVPLALWHHVAMRTIGLGEWTFRLPSLLAGVLLLPLLAAFARRWMSSPGAGVAPLAVWLAALSPPLFLFSRFARPYMPLVFLSLVAAWAALRWDPTRRGARLGWLLAVASAFALFLNMTAAPAVLCAYAYSASVARRAGGAALRRWALAALGGALLAAALIGPGLPALLAFAAEKSGSARFDPGKAWRALHILWGTDAAWLVVVASAAATLGAVVSWRAGHRPARLFVAILVADVAALLLLAPGGSQHPSVLARYTLTAWPGVLLFASVGLVAGLRALGRGVSRLAAAAPAAGWLAGAVLPLALWWTGPLPGILSHRNAFTNHRFHYGLPEWEFDATLAPAVYAELAASEGAGTVVEVPYTLEWGLTVYGLYQEIHGKRVQAMSAFATYFREEGVEFTTMVPWKGDKPIYRGIDTIVVHKDIVAESYFVTGRNGGEWPENMGKKRWGYVNDAKIVLQVCLASPQFEQVHEDEQVVVLRRKP